MPAIAAAVETFTSESIQSQALEALINAFQSGNKADGKRTEAETPPEPEREQEQGSGDGTGTGAAVTPQRTPRKASSTKQKQSFSLDKDLDLVRGGPKSLKDFVAEKQPTTVLDKVLIAVYWLTRVREGDKPATLEGVYTCFKHMEWPIPSDLANTTQQAGAKGWLDSRKRDDLKVVIGGENRVEHEMPPEPKK